MKVVTILFAVLCATTMTLAQTLFVPISNLGQTNDDGFGANAEGSIAASFTTGNATASLVSISISGGGFSGYESAGSFNLSLCSDAANPPGATLANLSGNNYPTNAGIYTYTNTSPLTLSSNTTYWIVASSSAFYEGAYWWNGTTSTNLDSGSFWSLGVTLLQDTFAPGYNWTIQSGDYQLFSVTVTNFSAFAGPPLSISQPVAFQPVVLTYPATNFPFVLQQNSNLDTTNWVPVNNVTYRGTNVNNLVIVVLPLTAPRMFYRLESPL